MRLTRISFKDITNLIQRYSLYQQSCLSIEQFTTFGKTAKPVESFQFGRHELPVRLAHIIREIDLLPKNLLKMPSVELVRSWYVQSFRELLEFQEEDETEEVTNRLFQGIMELRQQEGDDAFHPSIQYFLDRFYMSRISIRMLITQHLLLFGQDARSSKSNFIGCFDPNCHVISVVEDAVSNAAYLCEQVYCASPSVEISEVNAHDSKKPVQVAYIPGHLYHMLFELMKVRHKFRPCLAAGTVHCSNAFNLLFFKISDQGGGIPKCKIDQVFEYHYTSAPEPLKTGGTAPMAGYGYGLPLSRLYAKYFDGDLELYSMEGYGTDAVIWLKALSEEASEVLPLYNRRTPKTYEEVRLAAQHCRDWSSSKFYGHGHKFLSTLHGKMRV
ncbi:PREDICTED: pyruvate dehydrogenase (acetyl-transferring) kinase isozyme 2, mitochondrial-like [Acropora digitifera]|uniref:pyruvate dehydrogenase (acetyl-transferring) kinase isozyme 2, mitochondrial-like n=1 Tax=Acropora digitifera TaxID=70779 RepID=UPI00077A3B72|nr:PREDICTED: pyruvate dehydrogenase (acetyl-transferring) kinase isozyme 2, mitochondrial-like [Acropora digitifera]